jgi:hypothetical protein
MNWLGVLKKVCTNVDFIFKPRVVTAIIPKYALQEHLKIINVTEDLNNVYITFEKSVSSHLSLQKSS